MHTKKIDDGVFNLFVELKGYGLDGVEVFHSSHTRELREKYLMMIKELKMITAGGSDFHGGSAHPENELGTGRNNNLNIPYFVLHELVEGRGCKVCDGYYEDVLKFI